MARDDKKLAMLTQKIESKKKKKKKKRDRLFSD